LGVSQLDRQPRISGKHFLTFLDVRCLEPRRAELEILSVEIASKNNCFGNNPRREPN